MAISDLCNRVPLKIRNLSLVQDAESEALREDFELAFAILGNRERTVQAVARAYAQLSNTMYALRDNKRERYSARKGRAAYRPLITEDVVRRLLLLSEVKKIRVEDETLAVAITEKEFLQCFLQELVATVLNRNSFYAAVAITGVLANYPAATTLEMYDSVAGVRAETKDWSAVSGAKERIMRQLMARFGSRLRLHREKSAFRFVSRPGGAEDAEFVKGWLNRLLPSRCVRYGGPNDDESVDEMNCIRKFLVIDEFNGVATAAKLPLFEQRLTIPLSCDLGPNGPGGGLGSTGEAADCNLDEIRIAVAHERRRRRKVVPRALSVCVDGIDRGDIGTNGTSPVRMLLEEGASIVELTTLDDENRKVTLATYILTYDDPKIEEWKVDLYDFGTFSCSFTYGEADSVSADFRFSGCESQFLNGAAPARVGDGHTFKLIRSRDKSSSEEGDRLLIVDGGLKWNLEAMAWFIARGLARLKGSFMSARRAQPDETTSGRASMAHSEARLTNRNLWLPRIGYIKPNSASGYKAWLPEQLGKGIPPAVGGPRFRILVPNTRLGGWFVRKALTKLVIAFTGRTDVHRETAAYAHNSNMLLVECASYTRQARAIEMLDRYVTEQSDLLQAFLIRVDRLTLPQDPAPRIYRRHERYSRVFSIISAGLLALDVCICAVWGRKGVGNPGVIVPVVVAAGAGVSAALSWKFGWSRRIYEKYRTAGLAIGRVSAFLEELEGTATGRLTLDWRDILTARVLWDYLAGDEGRRRPPSESQFVEVVRAFGKSPKDSRRIARTVLGKSAILAPRELSTLLARELGLTERAAQVLERSSRGSVFGCESLTAPPCGP
jgi:hypothetical protein